jgi:hypothetical protein
VIRHPSGGTAPLRPIKGCCQTLWGHDRNPNLGHDFHFQTRETFPQWKKLGLTNIDKPWLGDCFSVPIVRPTKPKKWWFIYAYIYMYTHGHTVPQNDLIKNTCSKRHCLETSMVNWKQSLILWFWMADWLDTKSPATQWQGWKGPGTSWIHPGLGLARVRPTRGT